MGLWIFVGFFGATILVARESKILGHGSKKP
jgi:hypothetical protein